MNYSAFLPAEIRALIRAGKLDAPTTGCTGEVCTGCGSGAVPCKVAFGPALQHVVTPSWHAPRDDPDHGAASPKAVRQRTLFSCRERKYISSQLQWIASECGNGKEKIKIFLW